MHSIILHPKVMNFCSDLLGRGWRAGLYEAALWEQSRRWRDFNHHFPCPREGLGGDGAGRVTGQ